MEGYDVAQICPNGHVANSTSRRLPQFNKTFCDECGAPTITQCSKCRANIRGEYWGGAIGPSHYKAPAFCQYCGAPFPWTEAGIKAAEELAEELDGLNEEEKKILVLSLDDIVRDTPQTSVASIRFKRLIGKVGKDGAQAFKDILVDIVSETAKKMIWPI